jgi:mono/diheme cytochrome c family protein
MKNVWSLGLGTVLALAAVAACGKSSPSPAGGSDNTTQSDPAAGGGGPVGAAEAKQIFDARCAACHGPEGRGNGPGAVALNPKPRNYHDQDWQAKVTDDEIRKAIVYGGAAVGKSPAMPANPDLDAKPQVVESLLRIVRDFGHAS